MSFFCRSLLIDIFDILVFVVPQRAASESARAREWGWSAVMQPLCTHAPAIRRFPVSLSHTHTHTQTQTHKHTQCTASEKTCAREWERKAWRCSICARACLRVVDSLPLSLSLSHTHTHTHTHTQCTASESTCARERERGARRCSLCARARIWGADSALEGAARCGDKVGQEGQHPHRRARVYATSLSTGVLQECVAGVCCRSVLQECVAGVCCRSVLQECVAGVCCRSVL